MIIPPKTVFRGYYFRRCFMIEEKDLGLINTSNCDRSFASCILTSVILIAMLIGLAYMNWDNIAEFKFFDESMNISIGYIVIMISVFSVVPVAMLCYVWMYLKNERTFQKRNEYFKSEIIPILKKYDMQVPDIMSFKNLI